MSMSFNSTYQQVEILTQELQNMSSSFDAALNGGFAKDGDTIYVAGVKIKSDNTDENTPPNGYTIGVQYEVKEPGALGLTAGLGFTQSYILVATHRLADDQNVSSLIRPFQVTYNDTLVAYGRYKIGETTWSSWTAIGGAGGGGTSDGYQQFISSVTQPVGQAVNDYWSETTETVSDYPYSNTGPYVRLNDVVSGTVVNTTSTNILVEKIYPAEVDTTVTISVAIDVGISAASITTSYTIPITAEDTATYPTIQLQRDATKMDTIELNQTSGRWCLAKRVGRTDTLYIPLTTVAQDVLNAINAMDVSTYVGIRSTVAVLMSVWVPTGVYPIHPLMFTMLKGYVSKITTERGTLVVSDTEPTTDQYLWFDTTGNVSEEITAMLLLGDTANSDVRPRLLLPHTPLTMRY